MRDRDGGRSRQERDRERPPPQRLDRVRDAAEIRSRLKELQRIEDRDQGHTLREHVQVTGSQLGERARTGVNARGQQGERPVHATRWQSAEATAIAVDGLEKSAEYDYQLNRAVARKRSQFEVKRPLSEVLGPGWRNDVYGRSRASDGRQPSRWRPDATATAYYRRQDDGQWHLYSCYPEPEPRGRLAAK